MQLEGCSALTDNLLPWFIDSAKSTTFLEEMAAWQQLILGYIPILPQRAIDDLVCCFHTGLVFQIDTIWFLIHASTIIFMCFISLFYLLFVIFFSNIFFFLSFLSASAGLFDHDSSPRWYFMFDGHHNFFIFLLLLYIRYGH